MFIDLDANATFRPSATVQERLYKAVHELGNPSAVHQLGQRARGFVETARHAVRDFMNAASSDQVIFTSGATEANNLAIHTGATTRGRLLSSTIEHPCVLEPLRHISRSDERVSWISPERSGEVSVQSVIDAVDSDVSFVSLMLANNETGVVNNIAEIARRLRERNPSVIIHTDAAQAVGKLKVDFRALGVDLLTLSGHKFGALPGVGVLLARDGIDVAPVIIGGAQENKLRGGTENVVGIQSLTFAFEELAKEFLARERRMREMRDQFEQKVLATLDGVTVNGVDVKRLPNTTNVTFHGIRGDDLLVALDLEGVLVSTGAACSSGKLDPSHVLLAMGLSDDEARSTIRISFRGDESSDVIERLEAIVPRVLCGMRAGQMNRSH